MTTPLVSTTEQQQRGMVKAGYIMLTHVPYFVILGFWPSDCGNNNEWYHIYLAIACSIIASYTWLTNIAIYSKEYNNASKITHKHVQLPFAIAYIKHVPQLAIILLFILFIEIMNTNYSYVST